LFAKRSDHVPSYSLDHPSQASHSQARSVLTLVHTVSVQNPVLAFFFLSHRKFRSVRPVLPPGSSRPEPMSICPVLSVGAIRWDRMYRSLRAVLPLGSVSHIMGSGSGDSFLSPLSPYSKIFSCSSSPLAPTTHPAKSTHSGDPHRICSVGLHPLILLCHGSSQFVLSPSLVVG
jgi:hypothetical protein